MERCEGYYQLENRRCDRTAIRDVRAEDGHYYVVCDRHARPVWATTVAHWHGESDLRRSAATAVRPPRPVQHRVAVG
jgi:hypothetical protein